MGDRQTTSALQLQSNTAFRSPGTVNERKKPRVREASAREGMGHKGRTRMGY